MSDCKAEHKIKYLYTHDALACTDCDEWLEPVCSDDDCEFCAERPDNPSAVTDDDWDRVLAEIAKGGAT